MKTTRLFLFMILSLLIDINELKAQTIWTGATKTFYKR